MDRRAALHFAATAIASSGEAGTADAVILLRQLAERDPELEAVLATVDRIASLDDQAISEELGDLLLGTPDLARGAVEAAWHAGLHDEVRAQVTALSELIPGAGAASQRRCGHCHDDQLEEGARCIDCGRVGPC